MNGLGCGLQFFQAEGDGLVKQGRDHVVAGFRQVGVELNLGALGNFKRVGVTRWRFAAHGFGWQDGQARNFGVIKQLLPLL